MARPAPPRNKAGAGVIARALAAPPQATHPTLAHRIAEDLGVAIVDGVLADGARVREEELARHYGASRSPVREALDLLERRGLVRTVPRRGTHVVGQSLDVIADLFNMRAVLVGLASRYVARRRDTVVIAQLQACVDALAAAAERPGVTPLSFARLGGETAQVLVRNCGASYLVQMLSDHAHHSGWAMIWRKRALDFQTLARRRRYAQQFQHLVQSIARGADADAERLLRQMMFESRDRVLAAIAEARGGRIDPVHCLVDLQDARHAVPAA